MVYDPTPDGSAEARAAFDTHLRDWFMLGDEAMVDLCLFMEESGVVVVNGPLWSAPRRRCPCCAILLAIPTPTGWPRGG